MKKNIIIGLLIVSGFAAGFATGSYLNGKQQSNEIVEDYIVNDFDLDSVEPVDIEEIETTLEKETSFGFILEEVSADLSFGTPWKSNPSGKKSLAIEGRGPEALEEGVGFIYLKEGDNITSIILDSKGDNLAPKYVEWCSDNEFLVYMVNRYGRVNTGGTLYKVNVEDMVPIIVYKCGEYEEISEATLIDADTINIKTLEHNEEAIVSAEKNIKIK